MRNRLETNLFSQAENPWKKVILTSWLARFG